MSPSVNSAAIESALAIIDQSNGMIRMADAVRVGIRSHVAATIEAKLIKPDPAAPPGKKIASYLPMWTWISISSQPR